MYIYCKHDVKLTVMETYISNTFVNFSFKVISLLINTINFMVQLSAKFLEKQKSSQFISIAH